MFLKTKYFISARYLIIEYLNNAKKLHLVPFSTITVSQFVRVSHIDDDDDDENDDDYDDDDDDDDQDDDDEDDDLERGSVLERDLRGVPAPITIYSPSPPHPPLHLPLY